MTKTAASTAPLLTKDAATLDLDQCRLCERCFRRVEGLHVGSQRLGMIQSTPCERVFAVHNSAGTNNGLPWTAHVDGEVLRERGGAVRRYPSAKAAYAAACKAAPRRWHP